MNPGTPVNIPKAFKKDYQTGGSYHPQKGTRLVLTHLTPKMASLRAAASRTAFDGAAWAKGIGAQEMPSVVQLKTGKFVFFPW